MRITPTGPEAERERDVLRRAKAAAALEGVTLSDYVLAAIETAVGVEPVDPTVGMDVR